MSVLFGSLYPYLSAPHSGANSPGKCQSILPLLLPIHLPTFSSRFSPCLCAWGILPGTPTGREGAHSTSYLSSGDSWLLTISDSLKDGPDLLYLYPALLPAVLPYYLAQYLQWEVIWWVFAERMEEKDGQQEGRKEGRKGGRD